MPTEHEKSPIIAITMGDPAGIGPEIIAGAWREFFTQPGNPSTPFPLPPTRPVVFGDPHVMRAALALRQVDAAITPCPDLGALARDYDAYGGPERMPVVSCCREDVASVSYGETSAAGGEAAFRSLNRAIDAALARQVDAIVTAPLNKESLNLAGRHFPGHTEILASRCGVDAFGMAYYLGPCAALSSPTGLGVAHVTLHTSMRNALDEITFDAVLEKIRLLHNFMATILGRAPRLGVCALNCHAGDGGLFGREEIEIISPAVAAAREEGIDVSGPYPADTIFLDAKHGRYDGIVAQLHDQGSIAIKLLDMFSAVNVALGLPIIRTSVAHGTAFNISGKGVARITSLLEAVRVAALFANRHETP